MTRPRTTVGGTIGVNELEMLSRPLPAQAQPRKDGETIRLVLDWPSPDLSPNARIHWAARAKATKSARLGAYMVTKHALAGARFIADQVHVTLEFLPPDRKRRDGHNLAASCKAMIDGIADAIGIDDSRFQVTHSMGEAPGPGIVVVTVSGER